jgi:hypothetical protein
MWMRDDQSLSTTAILYLAINAGNAMANGGKNRTTSVVNFSLMSAPGEEFHHPVGPPAMTVSPTILSEQVRAVPMNLQDPATGQTPD